MRYQDDIEGLNMTDEARRFPDKFALRMPEGLRDKIAAVAAKRNRSTNAEIIDRLERSLDDDEFEGVPDFVASNRIDDLAKEIETLRAEIRMFGSRVNALEAKD